MSTSGALLIVCCTESSTSPLLSPSRQFNTTNPNTAILKTDGARVTDHAISSIYYADQATPLGMIIVMGHSNCALTPAPIQENIRSDIRALQNSPYIRKGIPIVGYILDLHAQSTGAASTEARLREVGVSNPSASAALASVAVQRDSSNSAGEFSPFWS